MTSIAGNLSCVDSAFFKTVPLAKISSFDADRHKKRRLDQEANPGTVNRELAALSHLFHNAEEWNWIDRRPRIKRLRENPGRAVYLTIEQAKRLLKCAKMDQSSQVHAFIFIALETSTRPMEVLSIRREHVDIDRRLMHIPQARAGSRQQPITPRLA